MTRALVLPLVLLGAAGCSLFRPYPRNVALPRYEVRLVDEASEPIRTTVRDGKLVYLGVVGQRYAPVETALIDIPYREFGALAFDRILETIAISYEDATTHQPLGTAPPPAVVVRSRPAAPAAIDDPAPVRKPSVPSDVKSEKSLPPKPGNAPSGKGPDRSK